MNSATREEIARFLQRHVDAAASEDPPPTLYVAIHAGRTRRAARKAAESIILGDLDRTLDQIELRSSEPLLREKHVGIAIYAQGETGAPRGRLWLPGEDGDGLDDEEEERALTGGSKGGEAAGYGIAAIANAAARQQLGLLQSHSSLTQQLLAAQTELGTLRGELFVALREIEALREADSGAQTAAFMQGITPLLEATLPVLVAGAMGGGARNAAPPPGELPDDTPERQLLVRVEQLHHATGVVIATLAQHQLACWSREASISLRQLVDRARQIEALADALDKARGQAAPPPDDEVAEAVTSP